MEEEDQLEKHKTEFADLQDEIAGIGHKAARFLDGEDSPRHRKEQAEQRARDLAFETQLQILLRDPVYAPAWNRANDKLDQAQAQLNVALDRVADRIANLQDLVDDLEQKAVKLDDGTAIFKGADGRIYTADGRHLPSEAVPASLLTQLDTSPSWEQYRDARDALQSARTRQQKLTDIQDDIDGTRKKLNDPDNPPSLDDLEELEAGLDEMLCTIETQEKVCGVFEASAKQQIEPDNSNDLSVAPGSVSPNSSERF